MGVRLATTDWEDELAEEGGGFRAATDLMHYMIARTTDAGTVQPRAFARARRMILTDSVGKAHAPECVRTCREPDAVWSYVKSHPADMPSYESRRQFFRQEFEPLLGALERFESSPLDNLVDTEAADLDSSAVAIAWRGRATYVRSRGSDHRGPHSFGVDVQDHLGRPAGTLRRPRRPAEALPKSVRRSKDRPERPHRGAISSDPWSLHDRRQGARQSPQPRFRLARRGTHGLPAGRAARSTCSQPRGLDGPVLDGDARFTSR